MVLTHLSLFSGIGGLDLAAEMTGEIETVGQCEWADYPTQVLKKHWPDVPRWRDIRTLTQEDFYERTGMRTVDIISGGFPCQPHSLIGKRLADKDDRHLWPEFMRVVREFKPRVVVGENVQGILSTIHDTVLSDLESENYKTWTFSVPAYAVGAHHERYRIFIVGLSEGQSRLQANTKRNPGRKGREIWKNPLRKPWDCLPGTYWAVHKPPVCGMADGLPDWMDGYTEYKKIMTSLGNAVVPQQAYPIFQAIARSARIARSENECITHNT